MSTFNPQSWHALGLPNVEQILGLAVFDSVGLPRDYFIVDQYKNTEWVQIVFQALGLQQLLLSKMGFPGLDHAMIRTKDGNIVVVHVEQGYIALFLKRALPQERPYIDSDWVTWVCDFEAKVVRSHPNFKTV